MTVVLDAHSREELDMDLLLRLARGCGGRRTGALRRAGLLEWRVTEAGIAMLARYVVLPDPGETPRDE